MTHDCIFGNDRVLALFPGRPRRERLRRWGLGVQKVGIEWKDFSVLAVAQQRHGEQGPAIGIVGYTILRWVFRGVTRAGSSRRD